MKRSLLVTNAKKGLFLKPAWVFTKLRNTKLRNNVRIVITRYGNLRNVILRIKFVKYIHGFELYEIEYVILFCIV